MTDDELIAQIEREACDPMLPQGHEKAIRNAIRIARSEAVQAERERAKADALQAQCVGAIRQAVEKLAWTLYARGMLEDSQSRKRWRDDMLAIIFDAPPAV